MASAGAGEGEDKDCLGCRLVGGGGCLGASMYVCYHASRNTHPTGRLLTLLFAGALGGVGLTRLLQLPPFDKSNRDRTTTPATS
ncbi:hypothetical protein O3P69_005390 [Scylla paramamosain]|uniref:Distal membrane-arm assembly complex protein 1-like domain-containing protein n=1 Tax=Scylla paramamosain TaxID=85552 RepID=A0AAW0UAB9_SCYPA